MMWGNGTSWPKVAAVVATIALAGGGGLVAARSLSSSGPSGYLDASPSLALFIQMTRNGGQMAGTIVGAYISSSGPGQVQAAHTSFTGIANGGSVTLTFGSGLFGATNLTGTLSGSTLVLSAPGGGGSIIDYTFHTATVGAYNEAVAGLDKSAAAAYQQEQKQAAAAAQAQAQRHAAAAQAQAQQQADEAVAEAAFVLTSDLSTLAQDATFKSQLAAMSQSLTKTRTALTKTQQKAQAVEALALAHPNGDSGTVCYDAQEEVGYDAQEIVSYDASESVGYNATETVKPEIQTVQGDIATVEHDLAKLQTADANAPSYHPASVPSTSTVHQAISNAQANILAAMNTTNSDISTANGYVAAAYRAANQAIVAGHCGSGLGTPPTVPQISTNPG